MEYQALNTAPQNHLPSATSAASPSFYHSRSPHELRRLRPPIIPYVKELVGTDPRTHGWLRSSASFSRSNYVLAGCPSDCDCDLDLDNAHFRFPQEYMYIRTDICAGVK